jgi:hypothetical protein
MALRTIGEGEKVIRYYGHRGIFRYEGQAA